MPTETTIEPASGTSAEFLADVLSGLSQPAKTLPCKYFYDQRGSQLFDQICELPEYYPTRTEAAILDSHVNEIAAAIGDGATLIEFGSGSSTKTIRLLEALPTLAMYLPIDISRQHLLKSAADLRILFPQLAIRPVAADFTKAFRLPQETPKRRRVVYFPGSTIGNFTREAAVHLLQRVREIFRSERDDDDGSALIGIDLVKDLDILEAAYDDSQGVTAEFNLNLLRRINSELGGNFVVEAFEHAARFDRERQRMVIELVSMSDQCVEIAGTCFPFAKGERIRSEYSHKYTLDSFGELAGAAGLRIEQAWTDKRDWFAVVRLKAVASARTA